MEGDGPSRYPQARRLLITADGGGSNGCRVRLWRVQLQKLADETGLDDSGLPLSAWHQQVEQDRTSNVLPHHEQLAGPTPGQPRGHCQFDREHDHQNGTPNPIRIGRELYQAGIKVADEDLAELIIESRRISRRVELPNVATQAISHHVKCSSYFC